MNVMYGTREAHEVREEDRCLVALGEFKQYTIGPEQWISSANSSCKFAVDQNANLSLKMTSKTMNDAVMCVRLNFRTIVL
jgi:hypothetical protein